MDAKDEWCIYNNVKYSKYTVSIKTILYWKKNYHQIEGHNKFSFMRGLKTNM